MSAKAFTACTIVAQNYVPYARVLARSFAAHHPGARLICLVVDGAVTGSHEDEPFVVATPADLEIDESEFRRMAAMYEPIELATALKPWLLRRLIGQTGDPVLYFDPDIELFARVDDLAALAAKYGIVLTPHVTRPIPADGKSPLETDVLRNGTFNGGFIGVGRAGDAFLDWWAERLRRDCLVEPRLALFVDQRWLDFVPGYFGHHIVREPGWNVAHWNVGSREITRSDGRYEVRGEPVRFFHFSRFDPKRPEHLWDPDPLLLPPRVQLEDEPALRELCAAYAERLLEEGYEDFAKIEYGFARTDDGLLLDRRIRRLYRQAVVAAEEGVAAPPPDPLDPQQAAAFRRWLMTPAAEAGRVSRYLQRLYDERLDLQIAFADLSREDVAERFLGWVAIEGQRAEPPVVPELVLEGAG